MAAASGPVQNPVIKMENVNEFIPPEPPKSKETSCANDENSANEFKVPESNISRADKKKQESVSVVGEIENPNENVQSGLKKKTHIPSPAEEMKQTQISIPYKEPIWGGLPPESEKYSFDVLKNGTVIESVELGKKPWIVFGRLPSCDVCMEHPSLSRYHAVVQYRETAEAGQECGWYLYDLDSTHGTWVNKVKVKPNVYRRLHVGHVVKFGGSSRLHILQGPEDDKEPESELSITELKQQTARLKRETEVLKQAEMDEDEERERQRQKILELRSCSWGMGEDATEEESEENPFATSGLVPEHEHLYKDDPKKALKGFYEREGCDLPDYQFTEAGFGKHKCVVELPVDGPNGEVLIAEATVSGKKKDAVVACALEACRLLDIHGMLHASKHESRKKKGKNWADDDFYDSDEDTFLDRTGTIEKKRIFRMKKSGKEEKAETYDSLVPKHEEVQKRITEIETKLEEARARSEAAAGEEEDALDAYMSAIRQGAMDTKTRLALKRELLTLRTEEQRLRRLVNLARPAHMPQLQKLEGALKKPTVSAAIATSTRKIGVAKGPKKPAPVFVSKSEPSADEKCQEEEEEEEDDEGPESSVATKPVPSPDSHPISAAETSSSLVPDSASVKDAEEKLQRPSSVLASVKELASKTVSTIKGAEKGSDPAALQGPSSSPGKGKRVLEKGVTSSESSSDPGLKAREEPATKKKKRPTVSAPPAKKNVVYDDSDPNYAMWMPPKDQSGDGRTSLNDKLGY